MPDLFSSEFAAHWSAGLRRSDRWSAAAREWEGDLVIATPELAAAIYLDLHRGECREVRLAQPADLEAATFVLEAPVAIWQRILGGDLAPIWAIASGRVKVRRGSIATLARFRKAAEAMVAAGTGFVLAEPDVRTLPITLAKPSAAPPRTGFKSTSAGGLDFDSFPMRLFAKAKRMGIWNPEDLGLDGDRADWLKLSADEQRVLLHLAALFEGGEEAVTLDLLPLIEVVAHEGRIEEEIYLTSFLWEEAKHVEFFRRFFDQVCHEKGDLSTFHGDSWMRLFHHELPEALRRLRRDPSPIAVAEASVTYNLVVEGVLAETGYAAWYDVLERRGILPATLAGVGHLKADESRHLAYGVYLLSRLVAEYGDPVWNAIEARMELLLPLALGVVDDIFDAYPDGMPFGLEREPFLDLATRNFQNRLRRVGQARGRTLEEIVGTRDLGD
jgi:ribonucleoside-diphosphate reductase beta chain